MPLTRAPLNRALRVVHIHGGAQRFRRLSEMGLCPGAELRVLSGGAHGPVLLQVGDTRLALGSGLAEAVVVVAAGDNPATAAD
jgi:ferrous iron transport protein A